MKNILYSLLVTVLLVSCNSKDKLASKIRSEITVQLQKRARSEGISVTINSFDLLHKGGNEYSGILNTTEDGDEYNYQVDVTVDGETYMWKIVN